MPSRLTESQEAALYDAENIWAADDDFFWRSPTNGQTAGSSTWAAVPGDSALLLQLRDTQLLASTRMRRRWKRRAANPAQST